MSCLRAASPASLELTLAILKPDVIAHPVALRDIHHVIRANNFLYVRSRGPLRLSRSQAEEFYAEHRGRFFLGRLVSFMSSGPLSVHVIARTDAIQIWRALLGPTRVLTTVFTAPGSIRGRHGLTDTRNCAHGSDSFESARREIGFFFAEFDLDAWYRNSEEQFRSRENLLFDEEKLEHFIKPPES